MAASIRYVRCSDCSYFLQMKIVKTLLSTSLKIGKDYKVSSSKDLLTYWVETPVNSDLGITQFTVLHFDPMLYPRGEGIENDPEEEQFLALLTFGLACPNEGIDLPKKLHEYFLPQNYCQTFPRLSCLI